MGACASKQPVSAEDNQEKVRDKELSARIKEDAAKDSKVVKILMLGAGESGKSTIVRQIVRLFGRHKENAEDVKNLTHLCIQNVFTTIRTLCQHIKRNNLEWKLEDREAYDDIMSGPSVLKVINDDTSNLDDRFNDNVKKLWADEGIQLAWTQRHVLPIVETVKYFLDKLDVVLAPGYTVSDQDALLVRNRTTGIIEQSFVLNGIDFLVVDVGGQKTERKKWIHCFQDVTAIIFVAALSEYNLRMFEDLSKNRMADAIELFDSICNNQFLERAALILFLNKRDLFEEKIRFVPIASVPEFGDFDGEVGHFDKSCDYFLQKFLARNKLKTRNIYFHVTCATDKDNVQVVFEACREVILKRMLEAQW